MATLNDHFKPEDAYPYEDDDWTPESERARPHECKNCGEPMREPERSDFGLAFCCDYCVLEFVRALPPVTITIARLHPDNTTEIVMKGLL